MRNRTERERDRDSFCAAPPEPTGVILGTAIRELCKTIDEAAELIAAALKESGPQYMPDDVRRRRVEINADD